MLRDRNEFQVDLHQLAAFAALRTRVGDKYAGQGLVVVGVQTPEFDYQRMYQLIRPPPPIGDRLFEIEFLDAGVEAYVFTFGRPRSEDHVSGTDNRSADRRARARRLRG